MRSAGTIDRARAPPRGARRYTAADLTRVAVVLRAKEAGLSPRAIRSLLTSDGPAQGADRRHARPVSFGEAFRRSPGLAWNHRRTTSAHASRRSTP
ncbi:MerR family transcriptional regulator [Streptomyces sp. NPDC001795]|uniref:MerR family transcriptional regulator n=1 Tax=Streptomyces sp. NPDC001795 TaxID=3154525 RepID=UPI0033248417